MRIRGFRRYVRPIVAVMVLVIGSAGTSVFAQTSSSNNYKMTESDFSSGSSVESCSGQYCARTTIGDLSIGEGTSEKYTASFGPIATDSTPLLEVIVALTQSHLGNLAAETTATKTTSVQVRNYLSDGYVLQIVGNPPKYANHTMDTPTTPTASAPGTEQFGINAADNSTPNVGASPVQVPSGQFSFGTVDSDYSTPNLFKYVSGDTVARSLSSSGRTDYTISMIVNISNATPAGHYTGDFSAVVVPVY